MLCRYCQMNDSRIHTCQNCSWTKQFFSKVIKWFNAENATSLSFSQIDTMFCRKLNKKNVDQYHERKLNFTLLFAKYYLYDTKLTDGEISMPDFIAKVNHKYLLEGLNAQQRCVILSFFRQDVDCFKCGVNWPPPLQYF